MRYTVPSSDLLGTAVVSLSNTSLFFNSIQVSKIFTAMTMEQFVDNDLNSYLKSNVVQCDESHDSFIVLGYKDTPTFFCKPCRITEDMLYRASPFVAVTHFLGMELISELHHVDKTDEREAKCGSNMANMLYVFACMTYSNDATVQSISTRACIQYVCELTFGKCQELVSPFVNENDISTICERDKMFLALIACVHENAIPNFFLEPLYQFLVQTSEKQSHPAVMALSILLRGLALWTRFDDDASESLCNVIVKGIMMQRRTTYLEQLFCQIVCAELGPFVTAFRDIANEFIREEDRIVKLRELMNLYTYAVSANHKVVGSWITYEIAQLNERSQLIEISNLTDEMIQLHSVILESVKAQDGVWAIGTSDGSVPIYHNARLKWTEKVFDAPISQVSLGPDNCEMLVISAESETAKLFVLRGKAKKVQGKLTRVIDTLPFGQEADPNVNWLEN